MSCYSYGIRCSHQGRPIRVEYHSTPQLYVAVFDQEYDGAPDSHHTMGYGARDIDAVADLIDKDEERRG